MTSAVIPSRTGCFTATPNHWSMSFKLTPCGWNIFFHRSKALLVHRVQLKKVSSSQLATPWSWVQRREVLWTCFLCPFDALLNSYGGNKMCRFMHSSWIHDCVIPIPWKIRRKLHVHGVNDNILYHIFSDKMRLDTNLLWFCEIRTICGLRQRTRAVEPEV